MSETPQSNVETERVALQAEIQAVVGDRFDPRFAQALSFFPDHARDFIGEQTEAASRGDKKPGFRFLIDAGQDGGRKHLDSTAKVILSTIKMFDLLRQSDKREDHNFFSSEAGEVVYMLSHLNESGLQGRMVTKTLEIMSVTEQEVTAFLEVYRLLHEAVDLESAAAMRRVSAGQIRAAAVHA